MADPAEIEVLRRCQKGSESAYRELVEKYQKRIYWVAHSMINNFETAREIAQEAFIRVFRNIARFDVTKNFYTWLYQIVVNLCIDQLRRKSNGRKVDIDSLGGLADDSRKEPSEAGEETDQRRRVHQVLDGLPPKYKAVLALREIQGFSCEEISEIVGCSNPTVRWRLHRARQLFKAAWGARGVSVE